MVRDFPIIQVPPDAGEENEHLGTKPKFWFEHPEFGRCLYKQARANTGEDWAEKIASELCQLLGLPHARVELATWKTSLGTVSPSFMPENGQIIHGNDILFKNDDKYPRSRQYAVSEHTLDAVLSAISDEAVKLPLNWKLPQGIQTAADTFIGYLMLDAWIGNTDRHHENWGFIEIIEAGLLTVYLAPTYDNASSMGRELKDSKRQNIVSSQSVNQYVAKCRSALYNNVGDEKAMLSLDAFREAAKRHADAARVWLKVLENIASHQLISMFNRLPQERISGPAINFAVEVLKINRNKLLDLLEELS